MDTREIARIVARENRSAYVATIGALNNRLKAFVEVLLVPG